MDNRPRWPVAVVATVALVVVAGLIVYGLVPASAPTLIVRPLPRAAVVFDTRGTVTGPAPAVPGAHRRGTVRVLRTSPVSVSCVDLADRREATAQRESAARADRAARWPHMPCTPAPGGVAAEHRYTPGTPVR